jgi:hypothetical protein
MHAPSLGEQAPSSLQRADFRHAALLDATHVPPLASHFPEFEQALDFAQSCAVATHTPPLAAQRASSLQATECAQSSLDAAAQRPFSALHRPCVAHGLVGSGFASIVPAQCRRDSAAHFPPDITHSPSVSHRVTHSACTDFARLTQLPRYASQVCCFWQSCEPLQSASLAAVHAPCTKLHRPCSVHKSDELQSCAEPTMHFPASPTVHLPCWLHARADLQEPASSQAGSMTTTNHSSQHHRTIIVSAS